MTEKSYSELPNEDKAAFDTVCTVMRMLRSGIIDRATPNWKVYRQYKKWQ